MLKSQLKVITCYSAELKLHGKGDEKLVWIRHIPVTLVGIIVYEIFVQLESYCNGKSLLSIMLAFKDCNYI